MLYNDFLHLYRRLYIEIGGVFHPPHDHVMQMESLHHENLD